MARVYGIRTTRGTGSLIGLSGVIKEDVEAREGSRAAEILAALALMLVFSVIGAMIGIPLARNGEPVLIYSGP